MILHATRKEFILEILEDRIVLDAAADSTDAALNDSEGSNVDPVAAGWTWEHDAWCWREADHEWWWWPDAGSSEGGNWLYHTVDSNNWWHFDWDDGWEYFFDAFYNDRYFLESGYYWGQDGSHNWYYTTSFSTSFSTWTNVDSFEGTVYVDYEVYSDTAQCRTVSGVWVYAGSLVFLDTEYETTGWHDMSDFYPDMYDYAGYNDEPVDTYYADLYSGDWAGFRHYWAVGQWTGDTLLDWYVRDPEHMSSDIYACFVADESGNNRVDRIQDGAAQSGVLTVCYDYETYDLQQWVEDVRLLSWAAGVENDDTSVMRLGIWQHGATNYFMVGDHQAITSYNVSDTYYQGWLLELGELMTDQSTAELQVIECSVAGAPSDSSDARDMLSWVAEYTGAVVYASSDLTCISRVGCTGCGGDWTLEFATAGWGPIGYDQLNYDTIHYVLNDTDWLNPLIEDWGPDHNSGPCYFYYGEII